MHHQQAVWVEHHNGQEWEEDEHFLCCSEYVAVCGVVFDDDDDAVTKIQADTIMCRLCYSIAMQEFPWRCPFCGCTTTEECDKHL